MSKKKSRRSKIKNASLKKQYNSRIRQEYLDLDYLNKLDDTKKICKLPDGTKVTELEWIAIFMKEWNNGEVSKQSEAKKNKLHRTAKTVKACTDQNNARNRDQYAIAKARNMVSQVENNILNSYIDKNKITNGSNYTEDSLIDALDEIHKTDKPRNNSDK